MKAGVFSPDECNGEGSQPTKEATAATETGLSPTGIYYDMSSKGFIALSRNNKWTPLGERAAKDWIICEKLGDGEDPRYAPHNIRQDFAVEYVGPLCGKEAGYYPDIGAGKSALVTSGVALPEPVEGDCSTIRSIIEKAIGCNSEECAQQQLIVFYGWLQCAYIALRAHKWRAAQVLALAGPIKSCKSLIQYIISLVLGGRSAKAAQFLQGKTEFNSDHFGVENLILEDEAAEVNHAARVKFAAAIKQISVNRLQACHGKHREAITLEAWWRCTVSLNDDPEKLMILPELSPDVADKIIILRTTRHDLPIDTSTQEGADLLVATIAKELPAFVHWLLNGFVIPDASKDPRFGIQEFHHPAIVEALSELDPSNELLELIDNLKPWGLNDAWVGTAADLQSLLSKNDGLREQSKRVLYWSKACGTYLGNLAKTPLDRVISMPKKGGIRRYRINAPSVVLGDEPDDEPSPAATQ
jgi:hypothetical protein